MADNYQLFSEIVPALTAQERQWVERVLNAKKERALAGVGVNPKAIDLDDWPGFAWEIDAQGELWLHAQECGNVSHAAEFVRALLARFRPADCWHLTWSETCSRPRVGEFGGGALFVTACSVRAFNALDWVGRQRKAFERRRRDAPHPD